MQSVSIKYTERLAEAGIEAYAGEIPGLIEEQRDITLLAIAGRLERGHGLTVAQGKVRRLLDRHGMTFKKPRTPASSGVLTSSGPGVPGSICGRSWTRAALSAAVARGRKGGRLPTVAPDKL